MGMSILSNSCRAG